MVMFNSYVKLPKGNHQIVRKTMENPSILAQHHHVWALARVGMWVPKAPLAANVHLCQKAAVGMKLSCLGIQ